MWSVSAVDILNNGQDNCNRVDTIDLWDGWNIRHFSLHASGHVNVGRTEVYHNDERIEFHDTVFYANPRWVWWYSAPACATHSRIASANFENNILNLSFDAFNPQGWRTWDYATTTLPKLDTNPLQLSIWKQSIDDIWVSSYAIGSGFNHAMKLNMTNSGAHAWWSSLRVEVFPSGKDATPGSSLRSSYYYGHRWCDILDVSQTEDDYIVNFTCELTYTKTSSAINGSWFTQVNNYQWSFALQKDRYDLCPYDAVLCTETTTDYTNPAEDNNNPYTGQNIVSWPYVWTGSLIDWNSLTHADTTALTPVEEAAAWDPVNLNTWEFVYDNTLMQYSGIGLPFEFKIHYENQSYYNGPIWNNFDFNYNLYLVEDADGNMNFHNGKLWVFRFEKTASGFTDNISIDSSLEFAEWKYTLAMNNNMFYTFWENLKVETISDIHGNTLSFSYDENKQLLSITDTLGRAYSFDYYDHTRIERITDFTGNTVDFSYFGSGSTDGMLYDLETITTTNSGSTRDISFTYTVAETFEDAHNIVKLIDSQDNVYVENAYDENDRVLSQKYGEATIYYDYTLSWSGNIVENRVVDRSGNESIYSYDESSNLIQKVIKKQTGDSVYTYQYNENNKVSVEEFPLGNGYTYLYDERENLIEKRMKADVTAPPAPWDLVYSYEYHPVFNIQTKITTPNGQVTNITLDDNGNVTQTETLWVRDFNENDISIVNTFAYNDLWQLIEKTDANGNVSQFEYGSWNLVKITKVGVNENIETLFWYDAKNNMTSITDGEGNITHLTYDEFNLLKSQTTPEGIVSQFTYNNLNKKTLESIILQDGSLVNTSYEYDILDNPTQITKDRTSLVQDTLITKYDNDSRIIETQSADNAINTFEYNESGQIIKKTTASIAGDIITLYSYDINNRLLTQTNPNNSVVTFEYDLYDRVIKQTDSFGTYSVFSYDLAGNIESQEVYDANNTLLQKQTNIFDVLSRNIVSNIHNVSTAEILTSRSVYDAVGNMVESIDPSGNRTSYEFDSFNRVIKITDSLGNITQNTYNKNDKVTQSVLTGANGKIVTTNYSYDSDNRMLSETNALGETESYTYNNLNQVVSKIDKDSGVTLYTYDYAWNMLSESHEGKTISYSYDSNSNLEKVTDALWNETLYSYNGIEQLESITYPDGNIMEYDYDVSGNMIEKRDPNGSVIVSSYDDLNRLVSKNITTGSGVLGISSENYSYDALSRLVSATDSQGHDLDFSFDSLGRLTQETASWAVVQYDYDLVWNRTQITNPNGTQTNYIYDRNNRLAAISNLTQGENLAGDIATYNYDSLHLLSQNLGNSVTTNYSYDALLRLSGLSDYSYSYNTQWNIVSNGTDTYSYDSLDRIIEATYTDKHIKKISDSYTYDFMGNRTFEDITKLTKNGVEKEKKFSYQTNDLNQYLDRTVYVDIPEEEVETATGEILEDTTGTGAIEVISTEIMTEQEILEEEAETGTGEIIEEEEVVELEWRLLYDNNGNLIWNMLNNKRQYIYSYDYKNRLVQIEKNIYKKVNGSETDEIEHKKKIVQISYDVLGRRIQKLFNSGAYRNYIYSNQDVILEENYSKKHKLKNSKEFIYGNSTDDILSMNLVEHKTRKIEEEYVNSKGKTKTRKIKENYTETSRYYYEKDHLWSIVAITDESATIVEEYVYDVFWKPYTKHLDGKITGLKKSPIWNTRLYTGREYDRGLKLYYNRARYYNPGLGRFISRDPIDIADDINLYAYVGNNSVMFVDRMGLEKTLIIWFSGYPWPIEYYKWDGTSTAIYKLLDRLKGNQNIETKFIKSTPFWWDVKTAIKAINNWKYDKLIILWHSFWADSSVELSNKLWRKTDLLITLDICGWQACVFSEREVSKNVKKTVNYYQMNDFNNEDTPIYVNPFTRNTLIENHIEKRLYWENLNQDISNIEVSDSYHTSIDEDMSDEIYNLIKAEVWIR